VTRRLRALLKFALGLALLLALAVAFDWRAVLAVLIAVELELVLLSFAVLLGVVVLGAWAGPTKDPGPPAIQSPASL
jgi:hypothetical protein